MGAAEKKKDGDTAIRGANPVDHARVVHIMHSVMTKMSRGVSLRLFYLLCRPAFPYYEGQVGRVSLHTCTCAKSAKITFRGSEPVPAVQYSGWPAVRKKLLLRAFLRKKLTKKDKQLIKFSFFYPALFNFLTEPENTNTWNYLTVDLSIVVKDKYKYISIINISDTHI